MYNANGFKNSPCLGDHHITATDPTVPSSKQRYLSTNKKIKALQQDIQEIESSCGADRVCWVCRSPVTYHIPSVKPCDCHLTVHGSCLVKWMNDRFKGRCPKCRFLYKVRTDKVPMSRWRRDPMLRPTKYYTYITVNILVVIVCVASLVTLAKAQIKDSLTAYVIKILIIVVLALGFLFYQIYQARVYSRLYERLRIYNNRVVEVFDSNCKIKSVERQHNLSSVVCVPQELASDSLF